MTNDGLLLYRSPAVLRKYENPGAGLLSVASHRYPLDAQSVAVAVDTQPRGRRTGIRQHGHRADKIQRR